ncbi:MAG: hypothetical protein ACOYLK_11230 [Sphingomonas sp.]
MKSRQKFASVHANVHNHFSSERDIVDRQTYKERRSAALTEWRQLANSPANIKDRTATWGERFAED